MKWMMMGGLQSKDIRSLIHDRRVCWRQTLPQIWWADILKCTLSTVREVTFVWPQNKRQCYRGPAYKYWHSNVVLIYRQAPRRSDFTPLPFPCSFVSFSFLHASRECRHYVLWCVIPSAITTGSSYNSTDIVNLPGRILYVKCNVNSPLPLDSITDAN